MQASHPDGSGEVWVRPACGSQTHQLSRASLCTVAPSGTALCLGLRVFPVRVRIVTRRSVKKVGLVSVSALVSLSRFLSVVAVLAQPSVSLHSRGSGHVGPHRRLLAGVSGETLRRLDTLERETFRRLASIEREIRYLEGGMGDLSRTSSGAQQKAHKQKIG